MEGQERLSPQVVLAPRQTLRTWTAPELWQETPLRIEGIEDHLNLPDNDVDISIVSLPSVAIGSSSSASSPRPVR